MLFFTIFGGLNGLHFVAAQKYLSEQQGRSPLSPQSAVSMLVQACRVKDFANLHHLFGGLAMLRTVKATTRGRRYFSRLPQLSVRTRVLAWAVARCAAAS